MRFGIFDKFGALNSAPVFHAFCQGLEQLGLTWRSHDSDSDIAVIWSHLWSGRMRANRPIWTEFRRTNRPVIVLEVGMLHRGCTWKLGGNGVNARATWPVPTDPARAQKLGLTLSPWQNTGNHIVIAMQRGDSEQWAGMPVPDVWLHDTIATLRQHSDRPIVVRKHPRQTIATPQTGHVQVPVKLAGTYDDFDFGQCLRSAWCVINWNSGPGSQAVIGGVPAFVGASSLAAPVANLDWSQIEAPARPDRSQWLNQIAHTEWQLEEISSGLAIRQLLDCLQPGQICINHVADHPLK
jgi:hypothetical protein